MILEISFLFSGKSTFSYNNYFLWCAVSIMFLTQLISLKLSGIDIYSKMNVSLKLPFLKITLNFFINFSLHFYCFCYRNNCKNCLAPKFRRNSYRNLTLDLRYKDKVIFQNLNWKLHVQRELFTENFMLIFVSFSC